MKWLDEYRNKMSSLRIHSKWKKEFIHVGNVVANVFSPITDRLEEETKEQGCSVSAQRVIASGKNAVKTKVKI